MRTANLITKTASECDSQAGTTHTIDASSKGNASPRRVRRPSTSQNVAHFKASKACFGIAIGWLDCEELKQESKLLSFSLERPGRKERGDWCAGAQGGQREAWRWTLMENVCFQFTSRQIWRMS